VTVSDPPREPHGTLLDIGNSVRLRLRVYPPTRWNGTDPVVLVHGLLSSSDIFDLPGVPEASLARYLQHRGFLVVTYDQRGAGGSQTQSWKFGLSELVTEDLPSVVAWTLRTFDAKRVTLGSHSLGGLEVYLLRAFLAMGGQTGEVTPDCLGHTFTIASPASFTPQLSPWRLALRRKSLFLERTDTPEGVVTPTEYAWGLFDLSCPRLAARVPVEKVGAIWAFLGRHRFVAALSSFLPTPILVYSPGDFSMFALPNVLNSRILDQGAGQLLAELGQAMRTAGEMDIETGGQKIKMPEALSFVPPFSLLTIASRGDRMIPEADVRTATSFVAGVEHVVVEDRFGIRCGHAGYLFKPSLYPQVYRMVEAFIGKDKG